VCGMFEGAKTATGSGGDDDERRDWMTIEEDCDGRQVEAGQSFWSGAEKSDDEK
jgi:hypothetical protein